jgi:carbon monoxide dehydrogenase subunit G
VQQTGEYRIAAARETVWRALNDPQVLARCIDGCQSMTKVADDVFTTSIKAKVGPVSATFGADLRLMDVDAPNGYTLNVSVKGGPAGFGKGAARVTLVDDDDGTTVLRYAVDGSVGGKLAQIGSRLIDGAARKMADDFFRKFGEAVTPGGVVAPVPVEAAGGYERSGQRIVWIIVFAVLVLAIVLAVI